MKADDVRAGLGEIRHDAIDGLHHQMYVNWRGCDRTQRFANQRTDGEIRYKVIVHYIEVNDIRAGGNDGIHFFAKLGEISRQNTWRDTKLAHGSGAGYELSQIVPAKYS